MIVNIYENHKRELWINMSEIMILAVCFQLKQLKKQPEKNLGLNATRTHDLAIPVQCSIHYRWSIASSWYACIYIYIWIWIYENHIFYTLEHCTIIRYVTNSTINHQSEYLLNDLITSRRVMRRCLSWTNDVMSSANVANIISFPSTLIPFIQTLLQIELIVIQGLW